MSDPNYFVITVAKCDPTYLPTAMEQVGSVINDLKSKAGALVVRAGVIATGEQTGSLALFQAYEGMDGFEKALDIYAASSDYAAMIGSGKVSGSAPLSPATTLVTDYSASHIHQWMRLKKPMIR